MSWIVELEPNVWIAEGPGDPGRTIVESNAERFMYERSARIALNQARRFRPFPHAKITEVTTCPT